MSWASSLVFQSECGSCWYTLSPAADHDCCIDEPATISLPHFCCPCCCSGLLFTCAFTCMLSLYAKTYSVTTTWGKWQHLCTTPCFQATSMLATRGERGGSERAGGKKEGTVFLTHTQRCRSVASLYWEVQDRHFLSPELQPKKLRATICISNIVALKARMSHSQ